MREILCGVYKITNMVNNKIYIGQSINIYQRWSAEKRGRVNIYLKRAFEKYGIDKFKFEILDLCFSVDLNKIERFYIQKFNSNDPNYGYNLGEGGESKCSKGKKWYNNGELEHQLMPGDIIPAGFVKGRLNKDLHWFNNGIINVHCKDCPDGYKNGRIINYKFKKDLTGVNNPMYGKKHSNETKMKIAVNRFKKIRCIETNVIGTSKELAELYNLNSRWVTNSASRKNNGLVRGVSGYHFEYV